MHIAEKIKQRRKQLGLSQSELARRIGRSPHYISQLEKNILTPSLKTFVKIAQELHKPVGFFLEEALPSAKIGKFNDEYVNKLLILFNKRDAETIKLIKIIINFLISHK